VDVETVIDERIARYLAAAGDGATVAEPVREAVLYAGERTAVAVVSSAVRVEIDTVLAAAGLADSVDAIVSIEDVANGKPSPEPYSRALALLGRPQGAIAFEDTEVGIASAQAAGLHCVGVAVTLPPQRLAAADEIVDALDLPLIKRLLG